MRNGPYAKALPNFFFDTPSNPLTTPPHVNTPSPPLVCWSFYEHRAQSKSELKLFSLSSGRNGHQSEHITRRVQEMQETPGKK